jgi:hypothetical protein
MKSFFLTAVILIAADLHAAVTNPYPNEIKGLEFYERYLTPLRPLVSDSNQVIQVLGSDGRLELKDWRLMALYSCTQDFTTCSHGPRNDAFYAVEITPKRRVSLRHLKFPAAFSHSYGGVSEINVTCDVYTDQYGLQYWIVSSDFPSHKKGDLLWIQYGPALDDNDARAQRP